MFGIVGPANFWVDRRRVFKPAGPEKHRF